MNAVCGQKGEADYFVNYLHLFASPINWFPLHRRVYDWKYELVQI